MRHSGNFTAVVMVLLCLASAGTATAQYGVIYDFEPNNGGIVNPAGTLRIDARTDLFGTASDGSGFELSRAAHGGWTEKVYPHGPGGSEWIPDAKGNYYTSVMCAYPCLAGKVIEASPAAGGGWNQTVIYNFGSYSTDGLSPNNNLVFDAQGNLYGTTVLGGTNGAGTVFELTPSSHGSWTEKILYNFGAYSTDAINPTAGLVIDAAGNLYGTTSVGGPFYSQQFYDFDVQGGTVFELTRQNDGSWIENILHNFVPSVTGEFGYMTLTGDGWYPVNGLVLDNKGNLYGTTYLGVTLYGYTGPSGTIMEGTVFELSPPGTGTGTGQWTEQVLFLSCDNQVFCSPDSDLTMDSAGNLYGTTSGGGSNLGVDDGSGDTIFEVTPSFQQIALHDFPSTQTDGRPGGGVTLSGGNLFGVTSNGGPDSYGTAYEIEGVASGVPIETTTTLVASPSTNLVAGEPITLTAIVTPASGLAFPTGTVTFSDPAGRGVTALLVAGRAVYSGKVPPVGSYSVFASYSGDSEFTRSASATITGCVTASSPGGGSCGTSAR